MHGGRPTAPCVDLPAPPGEALELTPGGDHRVGLALPSVQGFSMYQRCINPARAGRRPPFGRCRSVLFQTRTREDREAQRRAVGRLGESFARRSAPSSRGTPARVGLVTVGPSSASTPWTGSPPTSGLHRGGSQLPMEPYPASRWQPMFQRLMTRVSRSQPSSETVAVSSLSRDPAAAGRSSQRAARILR